MPLHGLLIKRARVTLLFLVVLSIIAVSVTPLVVMTVTAPTPAPPVTFNKTFGGAASDEGWDVVQTNGGYIAVGFTGSFTSDYSRQVYIVKTDTMGNKVWEKAIGDSGNDYGVTIKPTSDGGFIITGWTDSYGRGDDVLLLKIDANGNKQWSQAFGGPLEDRGMGVVQTNDGGYAICGWTYSAGTPDRAIWLIKTNSAGTMLWNKTFGGSDSDYGYGIVQSSDGGLVLTGAVASSPTAGDRDVVLIKTDANGNKVFYKTYGGAKSDYGQDVCATSDGGFFITGWTWSSGAGDKDVYIIKTDAKGNEAWEKTFGGPYAEHGFSGRQTADGGYVITGDTIVANATDYEQMYVVKTDAAGSLQWNMTMGGAKCDIGYSIKQTSDGGYIIAGETHSYGAGSGDMYFVKLGSTPSTPAKSASSLTCAVSPSKVKVNSAFQIKGKLTSATGTPLTGQTIAVQKYSSNSWTNVTSAKTDGNGRYSVMLKSQSSGVYQYHCVYGGSATYLSATSKTVQVTVVK